MANEEEHNEDAIREKFMEFQTLQKHIEHIGEQAEMLNQQSVEIEISKSALKTISNEKIGNEVLAPIANGIFLKTKLEDNQKLIVNVGSNVTVEKTPDEVIKLLEEQGEKIVQKIDEANQLIQQLQNQAMAIFQEVQEQTGELDVQK
jgi:prefoldin alpha subunit